jgi:hypothetical protein
LHVKAFTERVLHCTISGAPSGDMSRCAQTKVYFSSLEGILQVLSFLRLTEVIMNTFPRSVGPCEPAVQSQAVRWWSEALRRYMEKYRSLEGFSDALQQQLDEALKAVDHNHPALLFVTETTVCKELSQASSAAGIETVQRILPEHVVMRVYPDEVLVTHGEHSRAEDVTVIQPDVEKQNANDRAPENNVAAMEKLARFLGINESVLQRMTDEKTLTLRAEDGGIRFRCQEIEGVITNDTLQRYSERSRA